MSARVKVVPGSMRTNGDSFQPRPRSRAQAAAGPSVDIPPLPFAPVKFSGLIERDFAFDRRERLPRDMPRPLNMGGSVESVARSAALGARPGGQGEDGALAGAGGGRPGDLAAVDDHALDRE